MDKTVLEFLSTLKENNNRDWFNANKKWYEEARKEVAQFVDYLIPQIATFDPQVGNITSKDTLFRIYRDIRFSKDKTPYKSTMGSYMAAGGRKSQHAGYYLHIEPGASFLAGGAYGPPTEKLKMIRSEIYYNSDTFLDIINDKDFNKLFGGIEGSKLKRPPVGFPKEFEHVELLKFKDYTIFCKISDADLFKPNFPEKAVEIFKKMKPLNDFMNQAMELV